MPYGTVNADVIGTSVTGSNLGAGNASIMKNRIINGAMVIDQRNAGASVTITTANQYTLDRFQAFNTQASKFSVQQNAGSVTPPAGFTNYLGATSLSAYSVTSSDTFGIAQVIEGFNMADLSWGTANAKTVTLSFWVRSSLTGTFGGSLVNGAFNYSYPFTYSIPSANTWTNISVTIAGPTAGTWVGAVNTAGIYVVFGLGVGSTNSGTAGSWSANGYSSATGATSVVGTNGATWYVTGVQLEVGSSATGFEYVNYQTSLANCQRYYEVMQQASITGVCDGTNVIICPYTYAVVKRTNASLSLIATSVTITEPTVSSRTASSPSFGFSSGGTASMAYQIQGFSSLTGKSAIVGGSAQSVPVIGISAEL